MVRPKLDAEGQKELDKVEDQINSMEVKTPDYDQRLSAPKHESEPQTKIAQADLAKEPQLYLKPRRTIGPGVNPKTGEREKFNEKFRDAYNFAKEYVEFIAENEEIKGETINLWIKKFPGTNTEEWMIPTNKPIWAPRYIKQRLEECGYTVFVSTQSKMSQDGISYSGYLEVQERKNRLLAREVPKKRNIFMGQNRYN
jgi:hypothetical protein